MNKFNNFSPVAVKIIDNLWSKYVSLVRNVVIPYQWDALNDRIPDAEPSYAVKNFRIAAGIEKGEFGGLVFQDSDVAKWLEAVGFSLETNPDTELETLADGLINVIEKAQQPDGYLDTYFILKAPDKKWTNLTDCHELYCAGHMMEAAVAYYLGTGKRKLLDIMCRCADHIDSVFGPEPEKLQGYCGHPEVELALIKLYKSTGEKRYLKLSKYFIDERGKKPYFFDKEWEKRGNTTYWTSGTSKSPNNEYFLAHIPVREQLVATGHAVRAVYLYSGMADIAMETGDNELLEACHRLWDNIVTKQMYITGGIGSTSIGEAFTFNYDLPNDTVYSETCAAIGLIFFAHRMLQIESKSCYADVMERALYNTVLSGMALDGRHFLYVNPLEVFPEASKRNPTRFHVKPERQKWYGCACCPPNIARLLTSLGKYIYTSNEKTIYTHLYIGGETKAIINENEVTLKQETNYPWDGRVLISISTKSRDKFTLALRMPSWCRNFKVKINGEKININNTFKDGYALLERIWNNNDCVELELAMNVEIIKSNPQVRANAGKVALQRGPLVYCLEEVDNGNNLSAISIKPDTKFLAEVNSSLLDGTVVLKGKGFRIDESCWVNELYRPFEKSEKPVDVTAIPYFMWGNRKISEMIVWIREK